MNATLVQAIQDKAAVINQRVLRETYEDPFWQERYGERGRHYVEQDGNYHLSYLTQALLANEPAILTKYAKWLQTLLVTRGMCTAHILENFARLERALTDEVADSAAAAELLRTARDALRYEDGPARELQAHAATITASLPPELGQLCEGSSSTVEAYLSHLSDALAVRKPELFVAHMVWTSQFLARRAVPAERLRDALTSIDEYLIREPSLSKALRDAAHQLLAETLDRLRA